ncbi:hypothetical protein Sjap_016277 [Stephania japonica]|uniref:Uncharacterized protein n=1 Tax=Stephania japonica TaxID=461633 RepID=A0AAP0ILM8_9MAGN
MPWSVHASAVPKSHAWIGGGSRGTLGARNARIPSRILAFDAGSVLDAAMFKSSRRPGRCDKRRHVVHLHDISQNAIPIFPNFPIGQDVMGGAVGVNLNGVIGSICASGLLLMFSDSLDSSPRSVLIPKTH